MLNGKNNKKFLNQIDNPTKIAILDNIANHYNTSREQAYDEVIDSEADHLLEYTTGNCRVATSALMQKHGLK